AAVAIHALAIVVEFRRGAQQAILKRVSLAAQLPALVGCTARVAGCLGFLIFVSLIRHGSRCPWRAGRFGPIGEPAVHSHADCGFVITGARRRVPSCAEVHSSVETTKAFRPARWTRGLIDSFVIFVFGVKRPSW